MSIYATNGDEQSQFASNMGWKDLRDWVAANAADGPMGELCSSGLFKPASELLESLQALAPDDAKIQATIDKLKEFVASLEDDDPIIISDGMTPE